MNSSLATLQLFDKSNLTYFLSNRRLWLRESVWAGSACRGQSTAGWLCHILLLIPVILHFTHCGCSETRAQVGAAQGEVLLGEQRLV